MSRMQPRRPVRPQKRMRKQQSLYIYIMTYVGDPFSLSCPESRETERASQELSKSLNPKRGFECAMSLRQISQILVPHHLYVAQTIDSPNTTDRSIPSKIRQPITLWIPERPYPMVRFLPSCCHLKYSCLLEVT